MKRGFLLVATLMLLGVAVLGGWYVVALRQAQDGWNELQARLDTVEKPTSVILSADGVVLFKVTAENRLPLKLSQIPKVVRNAVLAAEDKRFYQHSGVDFMSMARVVFIDVRGGKLAQGGSTISMQLVKMLINGSARTFKRKMNDIAYAQVMEQNLTKDRVLELYLNKVYFGEGAFGIGEAAKVYFSKNVDELTIAEAAMLARCIRLPSTQNPIRDLKTATDNRDVVLGIMREENMITESQYDKALDEKPHVNPRPINGGVEIAPGAEYFVYHVLQFVKDDLGLDLVRGGYTIETTMDYKLQRMAEGTVRDVVQEYHDQNVNQGAFMLMDSDGKIRVEVGGLNFRKHQRNLVTQSLIPPGSGFKAFLYATALKDNVINLDTMLSNAPVGDPIGNSGKIHWYGNASRSETEASYSVRRAFYLSINRPAIHLIKEVTPQQVLSNVYDCFGFRTKLEPYDPLALGAGGVTMIEMAEGYSVFMLHGDRVRPQPVTKIKDAEGNIIKEYQPDRFVGVFDKTASDQVGELLQDVVQRGTAYQTVNPVLPDARGKTGTTNSNREAWFTGYVDGLLGVGFASNEQWEKGAWIREPMASSVYGGVVPAKFWAKIMVAAREKYGQKQPPTLTVDESAVQPKKKPEKPVAPDAVLPPVDAIQDGGDEIDTGTTAGGDSMSTGDTAGTTGATGTDAGDGTQSTDPPDPGKPPKKPKGDQTPAKSDSPKKSSSRTPKKTTDDSDGDTVTVEVCASTGLLANQYCPETVTKTFPKGKEPKRRCKLHGPGN